MQPFETLWYIEAMKPPVMYGDMTEDEAEELYQLLAEAEQGK